MGGFKYHHYWLQGISNGTFFFFNLITREDEKEKAKTKKQTNKKKILMELLSDTVAILNCVVSKRHSVLWDG